MQKMSGNQQSGHQQTISKTAEHDLRKMTERVKVLENEREWVKNANSTTHQILEDAIANIGNDSQTQQISVLSVGDGVGDDQTLELLNHTKKLIDSVSLAVKERD